MAQVWGRWVAAIVAVAAGATSCSSSPLRRGPGGHDAGWGGAAGDASPGDASPGDASEAIDFIPRLAGTICQNLAPCCAQAGIAYDSDTCNKEATWLIGNRYPDPRSPIAAFDADAASACLQAASAYVAGCAGPSGFWGSPALHVCWNVLHGTRALGEACQSDGECAGWADGNVGCNGQCFTYSPPAVTPPPDYARLGDPCQVKSNLEICVSECAPDAYCDGTRCMARHAVGACNDPCRYACADVSYCDFTSQACAPRVADGEVCASSGACANRDSLCLAGKCQPGLLELCTD